jgi:hypothetical protein
MNRCLLALVSLTMLFSIWLTSGLNAASPEEARLTQVTNDVQLLDPIAAARPGSLNDKVNQQAVVRTGNDSRAELTFSDETVVRLAANTAFSFKNGTRDLNLGDGAVLVQAPKRAKGAKIHAASVAAAIAGTTAMFEYHPGVCKFLVLEGTGRLYRPGHLGDSVLVRPGQLVIGNPSAALSDPVDFDIGRFVKTSRFILDFPPLRSERSMAQESQKQQRDKSKKTLIDTNLVIFGGGTLVSLVDPGQINAGAQAKVESPTPTPTPTPSATPEAAGASQ